MTISGKMEELPYKVEALDALIRACVEFTDDHGRLFYAGNIAGRAETDDDRVKRMMEWVSKTDAGLLECLGMAEDNVTYFQLGHDARRMIEQGGFRTYLARKHRIAILDQVRTWAPICISLVSLVVSVAVAVVPRNHRELDDANTRINKVNERVDGAVSRLGSLQAVQEQIGNRVATMQSSLDAGSHQPRRTKNNTQGIGHSN